MLTMERLLQKSHILQNERRLNMNTENIIAERKAILFLNISLHNIINNGIEIIPDIKETSLYIKKV